MPNNKANHSISANYKTGNMVSQVLEKISQLFLALLVPSKLVPNRIRSIVGKDLDICELF